MRGVPTRCDAVRQVEQGLGIGSGRPFFNRATASLTHFQKLRDPPARQQRARAHAGAARARRARHRRHGLLRLLHPGRAPSRCAHP